ncbi:DNA methyltransferase [Halomonas sp. SpR1]|uniref:TRM11 family SAM-dependent methyltransferase n=1 Tax=Halomonas sp. SpR1 TaxID=3050462 RepID=UPI0027E3B670|nr:DNA methyltransferase [Halomonas sp. SpR1]MDQ7733789.1 DNA methyltransferase [Halomonas sp. SpR1]
MKLFWHQYKYFPYEKELARREVCSLLSPEEIHEVDGSIEISAPQNTTLANRLVYFKEFESNTSKNKTQQFLLESGTVNGTKRQSTRYSAHGLHEYKGKFNPQIAKAMLNIFGAKESDRVLDPFCGSGTSLIECMHLGLSSVGTDINPLAAYIANAKVLSLCTPAQKIIDGAKTAAEIAINNIHSINENNERSNYLLSWFPRDNFIKIESLKLALKEIDDDVSIILLSIASNLLRDYSYQDPNDLRIRRRKTPLPEVSFFQTFLTAAQSFTDKLKQSQKVHGILSKSGVALNQDCTGIDPSGELRPESFDMAITSPPYATALPYIDTQRLSLIWLDLLSPSEVKELEARLIGSREIRGASKKDLLLKLEKNASNIPEHEADLCTKLQSALTEDDGFRRQVVPTLLYRYFSGMSDAFSSIRELVKPGAPFGLVVGGNHTVLSGIRFDINTPQHLANIATERGWKHMESIPLQTYKRYGLHQNNSTKVETLVILKAI